MSETSEINARMRAAYDRIAGPYAPIYGVIHEYGPCFSPIPGPNARVLDLGGGPAWFTVLGVAYEAHKTRGDE